MKYSATSMWISCLTAFFLLFAAACPVQAKQRVIIDADTANEVDDLFAVVRALIAPEFEVVGLNSTQWQSSHWATANTLEDSQRLNVLLLSYLRKTQIPHPRGARDRLYDWGQDVAQHSAAAYHIIKEAHKAPAGEKLTVVALGALTNVSSALLVDPAIIPKIRVYMLGTTYEFTRKIWRKRDFNCINDLQAIEVLLNTDGLETHIMPVSVARAMTFDMDDLQQRFAGQHPLLEFLYQRWFNHIDSGRHQRVIWDLALIQALIHPRMASEKKVMTPPENRQRELFVYDSIKAGAMRQDFYQSLGDYLDKPGGSKPSAARKQASEQNQAASPQPARYGHFRKRFLKLDPRQRKVPQIPAPDQRLRVILDSDATNEIDDVWALALAFLSSDRFKIEGVVAANFDNSRGGPESIADSAREIRRLLALTGRQGQIPVKLGSQPMQYQYQPSPSEGVDFIIEKALASTPDDPLWIVGLGASTNMASALLLEPRIVDRVVVFWHFRTKWPKQCHNFNVFNDTRAARIIFHSPLSFVLFDTGTYLTCPMAFSEQFAACGRLGKYLHEYRFRNAYYRDPKKGFFDLGDIAALLDPALASWEVVDCPDVEKNLDYSFRGTRGRILRCYDIDRAGTFELFHQRLKAQAKP